MNGKTLWTNVRNADRIVRTRPFMFSSLRAGHVTSDGARRRRRLVGSGGTAGGRVATDRTDIRAVAEGENTDPHPLGEEKISLLVPDTGPPRTSINHTIFSRQRQKSRRATIAAQKQRLIIIIV